MKKCNCVVKFPFGEEIATSQRTQQLGYVADTVRQGFTGYEKDREGGLDFAQARMYSSSYGRFTSPDYFSNDTHIADAQSWNLYAYVRNNPLCYVDRTGSEIWLAIGDSQLQYVRGNGGGRLVDTQGKAYTGNSKEAAAALGYLNQLNTKFDSDITKLLKNSERHTFSVNSADDISGSLTRTNTDSSLNIISTDSGVSVNLSDLHP